MNIGWWVGGGLDQKVACDDGVTVRGCQYDDNLGRSFPSSLVWVTPSRHRKFSPLVRPSVPTSSTTTHRANASFTTSPSCSGVSPLGTYHLPQQRQHPRQNGFRDGQRIPLGLIRVSSRPATSSASTTAADFGVTRQQSSYAECPVVQILIKG